MGFQFCRSQVTCIGVWQVCCQRMSGDGWETEAPLGWESGAGLGGRGSQQQQQHRSETVYCSRMNDIWTPYFLSRDSVDDGVFRAAAVSRSVAVSVAICACVCVFLCGCVSPVMVFRSSAEGVLTCACMHSSCNCCAFVSAFVPCCAFVSAFVSCCAFVSAFVSCCAFVSASVSCCTVVSVSVCVCFVVVVCFSLWLRNPEALYGVRSYRSTDPNSTTTSSYPQPTSSAAAF